MANLRAIIFDYYGTLADFGPEPRSRMFDEVAARAGADLAPGEAQDHWRRRITRDAEIRFGGERPPLDGVAPPFLTFRDVWIRRFAELFELWGVDSPALLGADAYADAHAAAPLYGDVSNALDILRERYKVAVLSDADSDFLNASIARHDLTFDDVVSSEDAGAYKPHVSIFRKACERLDVAATHALYVGDSPWADICGARNAGMRAIWINRHGAVWPDEYEVPETEVTSLTALLAILEDDCS